MVSSISYTLYANLFLSYSSTSPFTTSCFCLSNIVFKQGIHWIMDETNQMLLFFSNADFRCSSCAEWSATVKGECLDEKATRLLQTQTSDLSATRLSKSSSVLQTKCLSDRHTVSETPASPSTFLKSGLGTGGIFRTFWKWQSHPLLLATGRCVEVRKQPGSQLFSDVTLTSTIECNTTNASEEKMSQIVLHSFSVPTVRGYNNFCL